MNIQYHIDKLKDAIAILESLKEQQEKQIQSIMEGIQKDRPQAFEGVSGKADVKDAIPEEKSSAPEQDRETPITVDEDTNVGIPIAVPVSDDEFSWITELRRWENIPESDDKIKELLGDAHDWATTSWCAHGLNKVLERCGIQGTGSMLAASFKDWGDEGFGLYGDIAVYDKHVTVVVDAGKVLGCNQGNTIKESNLVWFNQNMEFLGFRRVPKQTA